MVVNKVIDVKDVVKEKVMQQTGSESLIIGWRKIERNKPEVTKTP